MANTLPRYSSQDTAKSYEQPEFDIAEHKKGVDWYTQNVRFYSTFYNRMPAYYNTTSIIDDYDKGLTPIEKGFNYALYMLGKQQNIDYNYITTDLSGNSLQSVWVKGKKVRQLMNHLLGNLVNQLENKEIVAKNLSKKASNVKSRMLDDLMLKYDQQMLKVFNDMEEMGITFNPAGDRTFKSKEEIERFINFEWKDNYELLAVDTAKYIEEINDTNSMYIQNFNDYLPADYCANFHYVENGRVKIRNIPFYNLIWDNVNDDPFNRKMKYVGFVERYTPQELFIKYPELGNKSIYGDAKEEIKKLAEDGGERNTFQDKYNTRNIKWLGYKEDSLYVTAITMFWIGQHDIRYKEVKENDTVKYKKTDDETEAGEYIVNDVYKSTLIGNKWLVDYGLTDNVIRPKKNPSDPELPIKVLKGQSILGEGLSIIGTIADNQDLMDAYRYKIAEAIGKDAGKTYVIYGDRLGETVNAPELMTDLKAIGIHVINGTGEDPDGNARDPIKEIDLSLNPMVLRYVELFREEERIMEEVMNIPKIALGQQQTYIGLGTQKGTIAQSTLGLSILYRNFVKFNEINLQYSINLAKLVYTDPKSEAPFVVGDRGIQFLKWIKEYRYEDILLFIKTKDIIDEQGKERLLAIAQALSQNQQIDILDFLKIEMATSRTELFNELDFSARKRQRQTAEAQQAQTQREDERLKAELETKSNIVATKEIAQDGRTEQEIGERIAREIIKADSKNPTKDLPIKK